ncbi:MAG TPA: transcription-repair coupling factor [Firmicutes bacterium]|jgi:transcription-repair coupling factor (superfamily II helicase)|nr:transcription-repair coupling factor [Bacillota bacterium]
MPHPGLLDFFSTSHSASKAIKSISLNRTPVLLTGATGYARTVYAASVCRKSKGPVVIIYARPEDAVTAHRDLGDLLSPENVVLFPAREVMPFETRDNHEALWMRVSGLSRMLLDNDQPLALVMPATALLRKVMAREAFMKGCLGMRVGSQLPPDRLIRALVEFGYERVSLVEIKGQAALRGGILDVFPPVAENPFRIEFFYDEIDSIRTFDPETQVSSKVVEEAFVVPALDSPPLKWDSGQAGEDAGFTGSTGSGSGATVFDYFSKPPVILVNEYDKCCEALEEFERIGLEIASARMIAGTMESEETSIYFPASLTQGYLSESSLVFTSLPRSYPDLKPKEVIESDTAMQAGFAGRWQEMIPELKHLISEEKRVVILAGNKERRDVLKRWLEKEDISVSVDEKITKRPEQGVVTLSLGSGESGFNCDSLGLSVFTETELYGRTKVRRSRRRLSKIPLDWRELSPGDYVVHANHGIGQFMGIKNMTVNGATRDYLYLRYAANDALYVPTDQVDMVEKYVGPEGTRPSLQRLGTGEWQRIKARVKKSVEEMARKLLILEAKRKSRQGHAYSQDTPWQLQFEEGFEYEDTEDQAATTREIKADMERSYPMDRLLCGDVGYGKTEVAMRAAFKAIMDSKQTAVLVPTTILAEQHYATFVRRFADYPASIRVLSRFRSTSDQKRILSDVALGGVDIIIGTHRLLSKDVKFKDLGLLIVDEEHRFGVAQKERLKQMAEACDVLTLTATPIPRTLNMALTGIRDVSVIETPPEGRFPVETYVVPYNPSLVSQAIRREMRRGGQVFYVHNRVHSISRAVHRVQSSVPEARIAVGHGKMKEQELATTMQDFLQGKYDVLISTTIIESGLDLPNVNTLIVEDSDRLGLAQLYQLRGRVGRSSRIAYAYFTYRPDRNLTVEAEQRLTALRDFAALGSGFKLAMRDMEIRGAGNLLGPEQHGFMTLVGYDMYIRLLEKAVGSLKGQEVERQERIATSIEIPCDAYFPESYITNPKERFAFYKRVAGAEDLDSLFDIELELEDRYGDLPDTGKNLLDVARLRIMCSSLGITQVVYSTEDLVLGKHRLSFRIEVPHVFPSDKLPLLMREFPEVGLDSKSYLLSMVLSRETPDIVLDKGIRLIKELSCR